MENETVAELRNLIELWTIAVASLCYCYFLSSRIPAGYTRLLSLIPVFSLFTLLPLHVTAVYLCGVTGFYLAWLANFKLLLFAFGTGPFSLGSRTVSFPRFLMIAVLPIEIAQRRLPSAAGSTTVLLMSVKLLMVALFFVILYDPMPHLHPYALMVIYSCQLYLSTELTVGLTAAPVRYMLGLEIETQFREPYMATSLQDFWGRRWNLVVTSILREVVYDPVRFVCSGAAGANAARVAATVATFLVSGLMHELIFFYYTRVNPTWEVTFFFVLQGLCTAAETMAKKACGDRLRLHRAISGPLTLVFIVVTSSWLFFPQLLRNGVDRRYMAEIGALLLGKSEKAASAWRQPGRTRTRTLRSGKMELRPPVW